MTAILNLFLNHPILHIPGVFKIAPGVLEISASGA